MKKIVSIIIAGLFGAGFIAACIWVIVSRGKSKKAIGLKIKTGAAIIALTSLINQSCVTVTCYDVAPVDYIMPLDSVNSSNHVIINPATDSTIDFSIEQSQTTIISYHLLNTNDENIGEGNTIIKSGSLSDAYCEFAVPLPMILSEGTYKLKLFNRGLTEVDTSNYMYSVLVDLVHE